MYRQFNIQQFYVLPTQLYLCVLCGSENKQRLFPYTTLTDWFVEQRRSVFTARYGLGYKFQVTVPPSPRTAIIYASYLRECLILIGETSAMGGPSAKTSNCSHEKKELSFLKMIHWKSDLQLVAWNRSEFGEWINPYPTAFPYGNGMVLHFYQQQESSTTKTVHKVINKGLKTYV